MGCGGALFVIAADQLMQGEELHLIGATGFVGMKVLEELIARGHTVKALARNPGKLAARAGLTAQPLATFTTATVVAAVRGHDALVSAFNPGWTDPELRVSWRGMRRSCAAPGARV